ncbi:hypothetical protein EDM53_02400 [Rickettsiales endosymbiont of Peranema trichophorum]|uniref:PD-(D/E)XK nuclease family protein n=1 Tax=Rickettsiales endosymbiont of Peranema trichophorum TaxID=2486577 RepID=UPI001022D7ED|nr:PD-(D/E)XK nuclease family protein [Rickettsiales endosymbiont of Peranema trichophorum]RZI47299.1 hypothetical protein EDM53_02400 [Rickettsiales endosymbiont of Peranema trichophorum]
MSKVVEVGLLQNPLRVVADCIISEAEHWRQKKRIVVVPSAHAVFQLRRMLSKSGISSVIISFGDIADNLELFCDVSSIQRAPLPSAIDHVRMELLLTELIEGLPHSFRNVGLYRERTREHLEKLIGDFFAYNDEVPSVLREDPQYELTNLILSKLRLMLEGAGLVTKQQRDRLAIMRLEESRLCDHMWDHRIYALSPYWSRPYIEQFLDVLKSLETATLFVPQKVVHPSPLDLQKQYEHLGFSIIETETEVDEAEQITFCVLRHLKDNIENTGVVTSNSKIKALVSQNLRLFGIKVAVSVAAISLPEIKWFMELVTLLTQTRLDSELMLGFLKHSLFDSLELVEELHYLETSYLQVHRDFQTLENLTNILARDSKLNNSRLFLILVNILEVKRSYRASDKIKCLVTRQLECALKITDGGFCSTNGYQALRGMCESITDAAGIRCISLEIYHSVLRNLLQRTQYTQEEQNSATNVQIMGPLEASCCYFDLIVIGGLNSSDCIVPSEYNPLVDRTLSNYLDFPEREDIEEMEAHVFYALISHAKVVFSRTKIAKTIESKWLYRLRRAVPVVPLGDQRCYKVRQVCEHSNIQPRPVLPVDMRKTEFSISAIERLMLDPYVYYVKDILGLAPLSSTAENSLKKEWGVYVHATITKTISGMIQKQGRINTSDISLQYFTSAMLENFYGLIQEKREEYQHILPFWSKRIRSLASWLYQYEIAIMPRTRHNMMNHYCSMDVLMGAQRVKIFGIIDRVIFLRDGCIKIIDYKTGTIPSQKDVSLGTSPQLPLEVLLLTNDVCDVSDGKEPTIPFCNTSNVTQCYIKLDGKREQCSEHEIAVVPSVAFEGLTELIAKFSSVEQPYFAMPVLGKHQKHKWYRHIIRQEQWLDDML